MGTLGFVDFPVVIRDIENVSVLGTFHHFNSSRWLDSFLSIQKTKAWYKAVGSLHSCSSHNYLHPPTSVLTSLLQSSSTTGNWEKLWFDASLIEAIIILVY
ncbi:uncharacterized protein ARMOST_11445 [Armillaria ostoyae]|uniref:Uncharacterized protein n=1 Tax=Armillaria ostoyae TaxID=47428 RepID=A0A284RH46_ARMOS|nr:uncharacterized protein ARMOST_11445 [Armillaria ostoyae]